MSAINDNLAKVNDRIAAAAVRSGRRFEDITLVAVTKKQPVSAVAEALAAGIVDVGENYVQEAVEKHLLEPRGRWHLLGHLQTNKAKVAVSLFDMIQSVDSIKVAQALDKQAALFGQTQDILLQVHLGDEETKTGLPPEQVMDAAQEITSFSDVRLCGLMGIAPLGLDPRPYFRELKRLSDSLPAQNKSVLSMGMSGDFEAAIEEGATMVRVGTAIFGMRTE